MLLVLLLAAVSSCVFNLEDKKERFGPDVEATLVIYFRLGTTEEQASTLKERILYADRPDGRGKAPLHNFRVYFPLSPQHANGHEAIALTFQPTATKEDIDTVRQAFLSSPEVLTIFENVVPDQIKPSDVPPDR